MSKRFFVMVGVALFSGLLYGNFKERQKNHNLEMTMSELKKNNEDLRQRIYVLEQTDHAYYNKAIDHFSSQNYEKAIVAFNDLKMKFPTSSLMSDADKKIMEARTALQKEYENEKSYLIKLLSDIEKDFGKSPEKIEGYITTLREYLNQEHPADLKGTAEKALDLCRQAYASLEKERDAENTTGIRITSITTGWAIINSLGQELLCPEVRVSIKNISDDDIKSLSIKASFLNSGKKEVFGEGESYVISSDFPLKTGYTKTAIVHSTTGYTNGYALLNLPLIVADVYIDNVFYKQVKVGKKLWGVDL